MNRKLFIRFFEYKDHEIPYDSHPLKINNYLIQEGASFITEFDDEIADWMTNHPDGKVDFVWL